MRVHSLLSMQPTISFLISVWEYMVKKCTLFSHKIPQHHNLDRVVLQTFWSSTLKLKLNPSSGKLVKNTIVSGIFMVVHAI